MMILLMQFFLSCDKNDDNDVVLQTIKNEIYSRPELSLMKLSIERGGLTSKLDSAAKFTVFAPTNEAFAASGIDASLISSLGPDVLKDILLYHVLDSKFVSADLPVGPNTKLITVSGDSIFVTKNMNGVFINGVKVSSADISSINGVMHLISKVLMPPVGSIVETVLADTSLSFLGAAVVRASQNSVDVASLLGGSTILTVFAPTNQAFRDAGFSSINDIMNADPNALVSILTYHVLPGRVFSSDLTEGAQPVTLSGQSVAISLTGGPTVKGKNNSQAAKIVGTNTVASNGVVHLIDKVLL